MTDEIFDWIIEAIPDDRLALHVSGFFDIEQWLLAEKLKPTTCTKIAPCWENAEIAKVVRLLEDMDRDDLNLQNGKLKCPLWAAASSRSLDRTMVALDKLLDRRRDYRGRAEFRRHHGGSRSRICAGPKLIRWTGPYRRCLRIGPALQGVSAKDQKARSLRPKRSGPTSRLSGCGQPCDQRGANRFGL